MRPRKTESERKSERERCGQLPRTVQESQMKANSVAINLKDSEWWCKISTVGAQSELTFLIEASVCVCLSVYLVICCICVGMCLLLCIFLICLHVYLCV